MAKQAHIQDGSTRTTLKYDTPAELLNKLKAKGWKPETGDVLLLANSDVEIVFEQDLPTVDDLLLELRRRPTVPTARKLTRLQVVNSIAQPLTYATPCTTATSDPSAALLHLPDDIKEWDGLEEAAIAFSASIPDSEPVYDGWSPSNVNPSYELTVQDCMDSTFFNLANQLGGGGGLAAINFCTNPKGLGLRSSPDRVWTWTGRVIASAECKQVYARPSLPGYGLLEEYRPLWQGIHSAAPGLRPLAQ
ncbi:hypothetical protein WJX72_012259 [[Myrmecia] bisecta]|uniref:Uncharacterized protein n=1 Tax=[Myrmecia] bisecta TaxID=41462 RepID=A0AAW1QH58_9CHLO